MLDLPNITPQSIVVEDTPKEKVHSNFDVKNYLNIKLGPNETTKTLTIRLLPMDLKTGNPFAKVHVHNVKVPQEMVKPGDKPYKSFICLKKNRDIDHDKFGSKCPYCDLNYTAYQESVNTDDPAKKKMYQKISLENLAQEAVIVRCIERGKEDEGVKFWKFNIRSDKTDPYNQIINLYNLRKENAERKGKTENILDIYNGRDLNVTITAEGTSAPTIVDDSDRSPLSENEEQMREWIFDPKKWQDVFTCKPYEYLALVSQMRVPWYDKANGVWIDKEEYDAAHNARVSEANQEIDKAEQQVKDMIENANSEQSNKNNGEEELPF